MHDKDSLMLETLYESIYVDISEVLLEAVDRKTAVNTVVKRGNVPVDVAEYLYDLNNKYSLWIATQLNKKPDFKNTPNEEKLAFIQQNLEEEMEKVLRFLDEGGKLKNFNPFNHTWEDALAENFEKHHKVAGGAGSDSGQFVDYVKEKFPNIYQFFLKQIKSKGGIKDFDQIPDKINWFKQKFEFPDDEKNVEEFLKTEMGRHYFWTAKTIKEMPEYQNASNKLPFVRGLDNVVVGNQTYRDVFHNIVGWLDSPTAPNPYSLKPRIGVIDRDTKKPRPDESVWQRAAKLADAYMVENAPGAGYLELPIPGDFSDEYKRKDDYQRDIREGGSGGNPYLRGRDFPLGEVIKQYPNGFFWVDTQVNSKKLFDRRSRESLLVNHCGSDTGIRDPDTGENAYEGSSLFSLRKVVDVPLKNAQGQPILDEEGNPKFEQKIKGFLTFTGNPSKHLWYQLKCKDNSSVYDNKNKFLIPYVVDIMVQLGLYKQGYPDFNLATIVDEIKENPEKYGDTKKYMDVVNKQYKLKLMKDKVEKLARSFDPEEFDREDDDVKEAYIELGHNLPNDTINKLKPQFKQLYIDKLLESPTRCAKYVMSEMDSGKKFNQIGKPFIESVAKQAQATLDVILHYINLNNDSFDGIPDNLIAGLYNDNAHVQNLDAFTSKYIGWLLESGKATVATINPELYKIISKSSMYLIPMVEKIIDMGMDKELEDIAFAKNVPSDSPLRKIAAFVKLAKENMEE